MPKSQPKQLPMSDASKDRMMYALIGVLAGFFLGFATAYTVVRPIAPGSAGAGVSPQSSVGGATNAAEPAGAVMTDSEVRLIVDAADKQPADFDLQMESGTRLYAAKRFGEAARLYERAYQIKPDDDHTMVHLGNSYYDAGEWEKAATWYERALAINPRDVNVRTDYGLTFWYRTPRQADKAIEQYKKSLEIEPAHQQTLQNLAIAQIDGVRDLKGGAETLAKLERASPGNPVIPDLRRRLKELGGQ